jgi:hypothetical protein
MTTRITEYPQDSGNPSMKSIVISIVIIFGGSSHSLVSRFQEMMESEFQMSMMGDLTFFLRYPSEANEARYLRASSQVHEGPNEEVQHGGV